MLTSLRDQSPKMSAYSALHNCNLPLLDLPRALNADSSSLLASRRDLRLPQQLEKKSKLTKAGARIGSLSLRPDNPVAAGHQMPPRET